ncbi:rhamnogalacturonan acetylesterase [Mucilaginibacter terrae]|uniref:Lysophospholipase L1-like esterase n=1 Tax=Mucilaginibacter terrae TaxID=1955052 RepID=A0ABU3GP49_9SPHI|nr:rhamnogalacturonan acetylesterase [Mucilaginibacter terrae]MDT3401380.1 lysophospholipase L1-like esterase [Mucilaginibacter terrae]
MKYRYYCLSFALMLFALLAFKKPDKVKVYLIGDSTVCLYPVRQFPVCGWGMPFADYFDSRVAIDNRAKGGRSTRTFIAENRWQPIADSLKAGDYVIIQFGHNDEAKEPQYANRYTPVPDYKLNLFKFITETRAKGASPILVTPVSRHNFDQAGNARETHTEYTKAVFEVGTQTQTPVIDLDKQSRECYQKLGPLSSKLLFMELDSAEHPNYPHGRHDNTHFNEYGARLMAEIVLNDIKAKRLNLSNYIVKAKEEGAATH